MIRLKRPQSGQLAAVIAPSSSGWRLSPSTELRATRVLQDLGLQAAPSRHMRSRSDLDALDWSLRVMDICDALLDPMVGAIFPVYGGFNSIDLLPHLPYNLWLQSRKPLIGYSDITALSAALFAQVHVPSLHGPNFGTLGAPKIHTFTSGSLSKALFDDQIELSDPLVAEEDKPRGDGAGRIRRWRRNRWRTLRGGRASGTLLGGNLPTLLALAGTAYFPDMCGAILLLECSLDDPIPEIDRGMTQLSMLGIWGDVAGIVFGSLGQSGDRRLPLLVAKHLDSFSGPILASVNCSHVAPIATLPYGWRVTLDADHRTLSFSTPFDIDNSE